MDDDLFQRLNEKFKNLAQSPEAKQAQELLVKDLTTLHLLVPNSQEIINIIEEAKQGKFSDYGENGYATPKLILVTKLDNANIVGNGDSYRNKMTEWVIDGKYDEN